MNSPTTSKLGRLPVLDGWRGISILCVLAGHMLPLGPKVLQFNAMVATTGMSLFFILSGFLIVSMLVRNPNVLPFIVRRVFRIVPLAWAYIIVAFLIHGADFDQWRANLLFYANLPPFYFIPGLTGHFWSLCVEMQFYGAIALVVAFAGQRGLLVVPLVGLTVTAARIIFGEHTSIITWFRIDEILAGGSLALILSSGKMAEMLGRLPAYTPFLVAPLLLLSSHPALPAANYARPYLAALLIGSTILRSEDAFKRILCGRFLRYIAHISYALYVIHESTKFGWLGEGDLVVRYAKRLGGLMLSFSFAHLSTNYYEKYWLDLGHRIAARIEGKPLLQKGAAAIVAK
jgi:peptidoglycan/LPS O-acetylase OafA/YrhL